MFLEIRDVLTRADLKRLETIAGAARFVDGRVSNPHSEIKNNLQIDQSDPGYATSARIMIEALQRSEAFGRFSFARIIAPPLLAKYDPGMNYGLHSDSPFITVGRRPLRTDLSCTLFIAGPETYEGGELSIQLGAKSVICKAEAGSAIVYPSHFLHQVQPVSSGQRIVGLTFIESAIPDAAFRELLYHLDEVAALEGLQMSWENRTRLQYVCNNLRRIWSDGE